MTELSSLLARLVELLDAAQIPFMIAGSFASTTHGLPRTTQDLDVVIDPPNSAALGALIAGLPPDRYYVDSEVAEEALRRRSMFNVIDYASGWKIDFILRKNRPFSRTEFHRRLSLSMLGVQVFVASAEDTIVAKLEWSRESGGSERQRRDVAGIAATMGDALDRAYIEEWLNELDLQDEWARALEIPVG